MTGDQEIASSVKLKPCYIAPPLRTFEFVHANGTRERVVVHICDIQSGHLIFMDEVYCSYRQCPVLYYRRAIAAGSWTGVQQVDNETPSQSVM